jgi:hypothetical protein
MIEGMHKKVWESDYVQFPRLLSEVLGMGLTENQRAVLCLSMGLEGIELEELLLRADRKWERIKAAYRKERGNDGVKKRRVVRHL